MRVQQQQLLSEGKHQGIFVEVTDGKAVSIENQTFSSSEVKIKIHENGRILKKVIPHNYFKGSILEHFLTALGVSEVEVEECELSEHIGKAVTVTIKYGYGNTRIFENIVDFGEHNFNNI